MSQITLYGRCVLLFTDEDLAKTAIDEMGLLGTSVDSLGEESFVRLLESVISAGETHVAFDLSIKQQRGVVQEAQLLLDKLRQDQN